MPADASLFALCPDSSAVVLLGSQVNKKPNKNLKYSLDTMEYKVLVKSILDLFKRLKRKIWRERFLIAAPAPSERPCPDLPGPQKVHTDELCYRFFLAGDSFVYIGICIF
ncbi:hypothetical protein EVAR_18784_1 [Eumeta japonica]|uniref:Uncharacterized protein n=1 Tax=Eumeta variegata TaxID=151549 RepID=A0A4C1ULG9_EUMVA|nr:hypothetical protein EVAR_18784_1 [Eumeta japonica]